MINKKVHNKFWYSLCEGIIGPEYTALLDEREKEVIEHVTKFVVEQLRALPLQLKFALQVGISVFSFYVIALTGKPISALSVSKRALIIETWAGGKISIARKLFRPLRSLTLLAFFEQPEVIATFQKKMDKYDQV